MGSLMDDVINAGCNLAPFIKKLKLQSKRGLLLKQNSIWNSFISWLLLANICLELCVPELVLNETRQDETGGQFPNGRDRDKTTYLWSRCLGKSRINPGKNLTFYKSLWALVNVIECEINNWKDYSFASLAKPETTLNRSCCHIYVTN